MSDAGNDKELLGRTFPDLTAARAHASVLASQGMKVRVFGPVKHGDIVGPLNQRLPWPSPATQNVWLVLGTDSAIETPPGG